MAEVRVDRWPAELWEHAGDLFPAPLPLIATLRSQFEGGNGPNEPVVRAAALAALAALPFSFVDLEHGRDDPAWILRDSAPPARPRAIVSSHFPAETDVAELEAAWETAVPPGAFRKVVAPVPLDTALLRLLPALRSGGRPGHATVQTTGGSGPLLRALGARLGLPLVYARLPDGPAGPAPIEVAQLPVDRLRRFFEGPDDAPLFALLGRPVAGSLSPRLHGSWLAGTGRPGLYLALEVSSPEEFAVAVEHLPALGFRGLNVTHPWKSEALSAAAVASPEAERCGVANCLRLDGGRVEADNTDLWAARERLRELRSQGRWSGESLVLVGAGGAARATLVAAQDLGARVTVHARRRQAAEHLARTYSAEVGGEGSSAASGLVVHATPVGTDPRERLDVPLAGLVRPGGWVLDWVYGAPDGEVARAARRAGATYEGGERLLAYQAARSFALWWGEPPPRSAVEDALAEVGCAA